MELLPQNDTVLHAVPTDPTAAEDDMMELFDLLRLSKNDLLPPELPHQVIRYDTIR